MTGDEHPAIGFLFTIVLVAGLMGLGVVGEWLARSWALADAYHVALATAFAVGLLGAFAAVYAEEAAAEAEEPVGPEDIETEG